MEKRFSPKGGKRLYPLLIDDMCRRLMDVVLSSAALIVLSPLFLIIAIAIKRSSSGPVLYFGDRAGKGGKNFKILKFRTMYEPKAGCSGPKVTAEDDPRITPLGRILRQTKINELPQLWNVLVGDMSLVGPRPEDPTIAVTWPKDVQKEILSVRPGITSPASVVYRNEEDLLQSANLMDTYLWDILPSKLRLDQLYVRNHSVLTDLDVILWTAMALLPKSKSVSVPEHLLYWGFLSQFTYRYLAWFCVDFVVSFFALAIADVLGTFPAPFDLGLPFILASALVIALLFSLVNALTGVSRINWSRASAQDTIDLAFSTGIVTFLVLFANSVIPYRMRFHISMILCISMISYMGFVLVRYRTRLIDSFTRYLARRVHSRRPIGERVLIVGAGEVARFAVWLLTNESLTRAFSIIGMVDDNPRVIGSDVECYPVINTTSAIPELVEKYDIGLILFAIADIQPEEQDRIMALCQTTTARIIPIPDIIDNLRAQFPKNESEQDVNINKVLDNATIDRLTGAYNYHHFLRLAEVEFNRSLRYRHPLTLLALSLDYIRPSKASCANSVTSRMLQSSARCCLENIRGIDVLGRYEGNLLLVLLPETSEEDAQVVIKRLKTNLTAAPIDTTQGAVQVTVDIRVASSLTGQYLNAQEFINAAVEPLSPHAGSRPLFGENRERKAAQENVFSVEGDLTSTLIQGSLSNYLKTLVDLQHFVDQLQNRPASVVVLDHITGIGLNKLADESAFQIPVSEEQHLLVQDTQRLIAIDKVDR